MLLLVTNTIKNARAVVDLVVPSSGHQGDRDYDILLVLWRLDYIVLLVKSCNFQMSCWLYSTDAIWQEEKFGRVILNKCALVKTMCRLFPIFDITSGFDPAPPAATPQVVLGESGTPNH